MLYLGGNVLENLTHVSGHWWRVKETWTTHAVIYTPKAAAYILSRYENNERIYDDFLRTDIQPNLKCYICKPFVCVQRPSYSDIWEQHADYSILSTENKLQ